MGLCRPPAEAWNKSLQPFGGFGFRGFRIAVWGSGFYVLRCWGLVFPGLGFRVIGLFLYGLQQGLSWRGSVPFSVPVSRIRRFMGFGFLGLELGLCNR